MPARKRPRSTTTRFYFLRDLAEMFDQNERTIRRWVDRGILPAPLTMGERWKAWPKNQIDGIVSGGKPAEPEPPEKKKRTA